MSEQEGGYAIRPARERDVDEIAAVDVACWREAYEDILPGPMLARLSEARRAAQWRHVLARSERTGVTALFVATDADGQIVGLGSCGRQRSRSLYRDGFQGEIYAIYVRRGAQRRGIGTRLVGAMASALGLRGCDGASLWVLKENVVAQAFYGALGAKPLAERKELWQGLLVLPEIAYGWRDLAPLIELVGAP